MDQAIKESINQSISGFRLPRYHEIPGVGLYLEQTVKYISECLAPLTREAITGSMISNYVKRGLVANPYRKQYDRDQIAYLIFIAVSKTVLSMEDIRLMIRVQQKTYKPQIAYDYFCSELENILEYIFEKKNALDLIGADNTDEKVMLRNTIITAAHKIYLDKLFAELQKSEAAQSE